MSEKRRKLEDHIREVIQRTGYPLEIEVSDILEKDWVVFNNVPYLDEDENKTRTIDIYAINYSELEQFVSIGKPVFFVSTPLLVECKRSDTHVWVFFTRPNSTPGFGNGQTLDFLQVFTKGKKKFLDELLDFFRSDKLHYNRFSRLAHTYAEVKIQGQSSEKQEIFEASNQLMKFVSYEMRKESERIAGDVSNRNFSFLFPVIAFDGMIYEAIVRGGEIKLLKRVHILLETSRYSKLTRNILGYLIDVVAKPGFAQYLKLLNEDIVTIRHFFASNEKELIEKVDVYDDLLKAGFGSKDYSTSVK